MTAIMKSQNQDFARFSSVPSRIKKMPSKIQNNHTIEEGKGMYNTDGQQQELQMTDQQIKQYHAQSAELTKEFKRLLNTTDQFKVSSDTYFEFEIQGKSFEIRQMVSYSNDIKNKNDPRIWYVDTVCPGSARMINESFSDPSCRKQWDSDFASLQRFKIDEASPNIYIQQTFSKAAAGGLVSGREFLDLASTHEVENKETGCVSILSSSTSIQREDIPKQKGYVRANIMIGGFLFETLSNDEIEEMELPKLMVNVDEESKEKTKECGWTRIRYILQLDIGGWLPTSVINAALSNSNNALMRDLRNFVIEKRLEL